MVTEITSKTVRAKHVSIVGTIDGVRVRVQTKNMEITDEEAKTLLETKAPQVRGE